MSSPGAHPAAESLDVLIIGAGFAGAYLLKILRDAKFHVKLWEAGKHSGGVWNWNRYPGARVDSEMPYYGYSDPAIWTTWEYTERFPGHVELRKYFEHVEKIWNLSKDISFDTRVVEACYQPDAGRWLVTTTGGRTCSARYLVACTGSSFKQHVPQWPGLGSFKGEIHHSSLWPASGVDMHGKRVAVIGAGASGIQILQESAKVASHACRATRNAIPLMVVPKMLKDHTPEQREAHWEERWTRGGFNWPADNYMDILIDPESNRAAYDFWAKKTRARISDPVKRDLLAPLEPPYFLLTKRTSLEQDYYEMADSKHVTITNSPIRAVQETGIVTDDGKLHEFDMIAIATGYDAVTGSLSAMGIKGIDGVELHKKWEHGVATHLGLTAHGFPNMFMVYGPQAPTSLANGPPFVEMQGEWIRDVMVNLRDQGLTFIEPKKEAEDVWRKKVQDIASRTLLVQTDSWYMGANVPGKKREILLYLGGVPQYEKECRAAIDGWADFLVR